MYSNIRSLGVTGIGGYEVGVEVYISNGLPAFDVVGTDPYPIPDWPFSMAAKWARWARRGTRGRRFRRGRAGPWGNRVLFCPIIRFYKRKNYDETREGQYILAFTGFTT